MTVTLTTERLILRQWKPSDYGAFAELNADPHTMRYFAALLSTTESDQLATKITNLIDDKGWGFWAVERKDTSDFIGFVGLHYQDQAIPNAPFVEIGWRLLSAHWGKGYAPEAANEALRFAFEQLNETSVYAFTTLTNEPSRRVMQKIGMHDLKQDFNHPQLDQNHPLVRHCLYQITVKQWRESKR